MSIVIGGITGEVVKDGIVQSRQFMVGCDRHPKVEEMRRSRTIAKDGTENFGYTCPKCHQWVSEDDVNVAYRRHERQKEFQERMNKMRESTLDK